MEALILFFFVLIIIQFNKSKKRKIELNIFFKSKIEEINAANSQFIFNLDFFEGYFANYDLQCWLILWKNLFKQIEGKQYKRINLLIDEVKAISDFFQYYNNSDNIRADFNKKFIKEEIDKYSNFFDNIENKRLDIQQRTAVVTDEDNNLIIAGAGSGKTTTIVAKVKYIIKRYKINPKDILLISFTRKSTSTLAYRIDDKSVVAKTFHKFGKDIIAEVEGKQPSIFNEAKFKFLLTKYFKTLIKDKKYLKKVTDYFIYLLKPTKSQFDFKNKGEYIQFLKDHNFQSYKLKKIHSNGRTTFKMEVVKSIEECKIANFLLFNNVDYQYELPYEYQTSSKSYSQYKPDFTIFHNGRKYYLEHFGVSRTGDVPSWFEGDSYRTAKKKYNDEMEWKRKIHKQNKTILIETYSYEMSEGILFKNLTKKLSSLGIKLIPKSPKEIWQIINKVADNEIENFTSLISTFITLLKSNNYSIVDIINKSNKIKDNYSHKRTIAFIEIIKPIFDLYEKYLKENNEIDFSDLINKASFYINNGDYRDSFRYIIIDEFQDISIGRYQLIKAVLSINPTCKLYCVGDDWQSIYRFTGSDIALLKDFPEFFGYTANTKIETTYRFNNPLKDLSSKFILKNPSQVPKELISSNILETNYQIKYSTSNNQDDTIVLKDIFNELIYTFEDIEKKEILILGRYSFDIDRIKEDTNLQININNQTINYIYNQSYEKLAKIKAQFLTVHKAKGLEADIIIILNCNSGKYGFPSEMSDDQVLNILLSEKEEFDNSEERRLFYVAMTRAKEIVYIVANSVYKSKFIVELESENDQSGISKCPICKTADVVLRKKGIAKNGSAYKFYGCSNYLYGCEYTFTEWD